MLEFSVPVIFCSQSSAEIGGLVLRVAVLPGRVSVISRRECVCICVVWRRQNPTPPPVEHLCFQSAFCPEEQVRHACSFAPSSSISIDGRGKEEGKYLCGVFLGKGSFLIYSFVFLKLLRSVVGKPIVTLGRAPGRETVSLA